MKKGIERFVLCTFLLLSAAFESNAQKIYFKEGFELGARPAEWTEEAVVGNVPWRYRNGGYNPADPNLLTDPAKYDLFRNPDKAYAGTYNAWFFTQGFGREQTKLISPPINMKFAVAPVLKFWLTLYEWHVLTGINKDILRVYYKVGLNGGWRLLQTYNFGQNIWRDFQIDLPNEALQKDVYIAFEGLSRWGMGVCLDEVAVEETGALNRSLTEATPEPVTFDMIPNGTNNNPILCSRLKVTGNAGDAILNSVRVNATATVLGNISKVKLYTTAEPTFNTTNKIAEGTLTGSSVTLTPTTTCNLPTGYTYLWVTYDIDAAAKSGNTVDAEIAANGISVNGAAFNAAAINSTGIRTIKQNLFFDDFETIKGWVLTGDFEIAEPKGLVGTSGNPDPSHAVSGTKVLGNDLTSDGVYPPNIPVNAPYTATSPTIDATYYKGNTINFKRWLNADIFDKVSVQASPDNGKTWEEVWTNGTYATDDQWTSQSITLPASFDRKSQIKVRFTLASNDTREFTGWNIDDFSVIGNFMEKDLALNEIVSPTSTCGNAASAIPFSIRVKNAGSKVATAPIPVRLTINEKTIIDATINENINPGQEKVVDLGKTLPSTLYGDIKIDAQVLLPDDEDATNDKATTTVHISKTFPLPYENNFDTADDWVKDGYNWMHGSSTAAGIIGENTSDKMWITDLNGNYENNARSTLTSPCFDIEGLERPMLEFKTSYVTELGKDGVTLSYSTDNGNTWVLLGKNGELPWDNYWGWASQSLIASSGKVGFTGNSNGWKTISHLLPIALKNTKAVKFRFEFTSDAQNNAFSGFGLNGFAIKEAPDDFGDLVVTKPVTLTGTQTCGGFSDAEHITFKVKNCGIKAAKKGATIKVSFRSEYSTPTGTTPSRIEEFEETYTLANPLNVGDYVVFITNKTIDMNRGGVYNIKLKNIDSPENFYLTNNDNLTHRVEVHKPVVDLGPTVTIEPDDPNAKSFNIHTYVDGTGYTINWAKKVGSNDWTDLANNGESQSYGRAEFAYPNNKISYKVTLTDPKTTCNVSSVVDVYALNPDIQPKSLVSPTSVCQLSDKQQLTISLLNNGQDIDVIKANTEITLKIRVNNGPTIEHKFRTTKDIASGETIEELLPNTFNLSAKGAYPVEISATIPKDIKTTDTKTVVVESYGFPDFTLTPSKVTVDNAITFTFDASTPTKFDGYKWYDNTTDPTNTITFPGPADGKVWCTVTDIHKCSTKSEASIVFSIKDIALKSIDNIATDCTHEPTLKPAVTIENTGNVTIASGTTIPFKVTVNGGTSDNSYVLTADLAPKATIVAVLNTPIDISAKGKHKVSITANLDKDVVATNNQQSVDVETYGLPVSNLPKEIRTKDVEVTLDAGAGFPEYLWSTKEISQSIVVSKSATYNVKITDANKCSKVYETNVTFIRNDLKIDLTSTYGTGNSVCSGTTEYPISVRITNTGNDTPKTGATIKLAAQSGANKIAEELVLANDLAPNASIDYTFKQKIAFNEAKDTPVSAMLDIDDMDLVNNFTTVTTVRVKQTPAVDLGADVIETGATHTIIPTITPELGTYTYAWSNGVATKALQVSQPGTYKLTVSNEGCTGADEVIVSFNHKDFMLESVDSPTVMCATNEPSTVAATIKNSGVENIPAGTEVALTFTMGTETATEKITLDKELTIGQRIKHTFATKLSKLQEGQSLTVSLASNADGIVTNNAIADIKVNPLPSFTLTNPTVSNAAQVEIAGPAGMTKYAWSNSATTQNTTVTTEGTYSLTVTDAKGCSATQSTKVIFTPDIELVSFANGPLCQSTTAQPLTVVIANKTGKLIAKGTEIRVKGTIDGAGFTDTKALDADLNPQQQATLTLSTKLPTESLKEYPVTVTIEPITNETNIANNTKSATLKVLESPTFTLPADIISTNSQEVIDGPVNMASYEWRRDADVVTTTRTLTATKSGTYTLKVSNANGCSTERSIIVTFKGGDLVLKSVENKEKLCQSGAPVPLSIVIGNDGTMPITKGETITVSSKSGGNVKSESFVLTEDLQPKSVATIALTSTTGINALTAGTQTTVEVSVSYPFDVDKNNPAVTKTFSIMANPSFSIDVKPDATRSSATLSANKSDLSYVWSNGATSKEITVYENSLYKVVGTNTDGCKLTKQVAIDYLVASAVNYIAVYPKVSETKCYDGNKSAFEAKLVNESVNSTVKAGTKVTISCTYLITKTDNSTVEYKLNGITTISADLKPTESVIYSFDNLMLQGKQQANLIEGLAGKHSISGYTEVDGKKSAMKNTQFEIYPIPVFDLGNDVIYRPLPGALSVNLPGENTFLWSTGEKTSSIIISTEGKYSVTVTNKHQCSATDEVEVKKGAEDLTMKVSVYPNPATTTVNIEAFASTKSDITIELYSATGILLESKAFKNVSEATLMGYDISRFETGTYAVVVRTIDKKIGKLLQIAR